MWNIKKDNNENEDDFKPITVPVDPIVTTGAGVEAWWRKPITNTTINQINSIDREELTNNPELLDGIRSILEDDGFGQLAYELTPDDAVKNFYTWGRNYDSSDIGFLREGKKAISLARKAKLYEDPNFGHARKNELIIENDRKLRNFNAALDLWGKVDNIAESMKKGNWQEAVGGVFENTLNVLNPAESPTTYGPQIFASLGRKLITKLGGKQTLKYIVGDELQDHTKARLLKEVGYYSAVDGMLGLGIDAYVQNAFMQVGRQDEWNYYQSGFTALTGMVAGGVRLLTELPKTKPIEKHTFGFPGFYTKLEMTQAEKAMAHSRLNIRSKKLNELWQKMTEGGSALLNPANSEKHIDFMHFFLNGYKHPTDPSKNVTGIFETLHDSLGVAYLQNLRNKKGGGEFMKNLTFMLNEVIDSDTKKEISKQLRNMDKEGLWRKSILEGDPTVRIDNRTKMDSYWDVLLRTMTQTASRGGRELGFFGNFSKKFYNDPAKNIDDTLTDKEFLSKWRKGRDFGNYWQMNWKRAVITNFTTSIYNLGGWTTQSAVNVGSDATLLALHSWALPGKLLYNYAKKGVTGNKDIRPLADALQTSKNLFFNTKARLGALANPNATSELMKKFLFLDPKSAEVLNKYVGGGFEAGMDLATVAKKIGSVKIETVDGVRKVVPKITTTIKATEDVLALGRVLMMTDLIDNFTKSQSFIVNLDRALRELMPGQNKILGDTKGLKAFVNLPKEDLQAALKGDYFFEAMSRAVKTTQEDIYSKPYSLKGEEWMYGISDSWFGRNVPGVKLVGDAAQTTMPFLTKFIEEIGNIPVLGVYFPFGRFFNNMTAFTWDAMGGGSPAMLIELMKTGNVSLQTQRRNAKMIWTGGVGVTIAGVTNAFGSEDGVLQKTDVFNKEWQEEFFQGYDESTWADKAQELYDAISILDGSKTIEILGDVAKDYAMLPGEMLMKGLTDYSLLSQCIAEDQKKLKLGLSWDEAIYNGKPINIRYHFPLSQCFATARAYNVINSTNEDGSRGRLDREMKRDLAEQYALGSATRQLGAAGNVMNLLFRFIDGDFESVSDALAILGRNTVQQYISGSTRVLSPFQTIVDGIQTDPDNGMKLNVPDKESLEALVWNSSRYFRNIFDALGMNVLDISEKLDPSKVIPESSMTRDVGLDPTKSTYSVMGDLFGTKGIAPKSSFEILLSKANMATYPINRPKAPGHEHVLHNIIAPILEDRSFSLRNSKEFINASITERKVMVASMLRDAKKDLDDSIFGGLVNTNIKIPGIKGNSDMTSFLRKVRQIQKVAELSKKDRRAAITSLNAKLGEGHPLILNPTTHPRDLYKMIQEGGVYADENYLMLLLEEHRKLTKSKKESGTKSNLNLNKVIRESTGEVFDEWGNIEPLVR